MPNAKTNLALRGEFIWQNEAKEHPASTASQIRSKQGFTLHSAQLSSLPRHFGLKGKD